MNLDGGAETRHVKRVLAAIARDAAVSNPKTGSKRNGVPRTIEASWRRCVLSHGIEPHKVRQPVILSHVEVTPLRDRFDVLKSIFAPELDRLHERLAKLDYVVLLANADGVVLLASDPEWRYRTLQPLVAAQRERIEASRQFAGEALETLDWSVKEGEQTAEIGGERLLYLRTADLPNSWTLHFFEPLDQAVTSAWLSTGVFVILSMMGFIAFQFSRARRIGAALQRSEREEVLLRQANEKLAIEIEERHAAERNLQKTQAELERAGRLAALGQLASSVTHELGQPIAAMRNQLAAAELTHGPTALSDKMQGLVTRMESTTKQLKFFSRKGRDQFEALDLRTVLDPALDLLAPNITHIRARVSVESPELPLPVFGNRMRLEQVVTNVLRNALDAVETSETRQIDIGMGCDEDHVWLSVSDSGHGLGDQTFEDLREPFATTRESGKGMGLGLTISAGIVADHQGTISARNGASGGAEFRIELPRHIEAQDDGA